LAREVATDQNRLHEAVVGQVVGRDVPLDAVDHVLVAVPACGGRQRGDVRAGELLGDGVRLVLLTPHGGQQPPLTLDVGGDVDPPLRRGGHHPPEPVGRPAALLLHQHLLQRGAATAPHGRRHVGGKEAQIDCPAVVFRGHLLRELSTRQLGLEFERDQRVDEVVRRVPDASISLR
jgi:hypothetical protein